VVGVLDEMQPEVVVDRIAEGGADLTVIAHGDRRPDAVVGRPEERDDLALNPAERPVAFIEAVELIAGALEGGGPAVAAELGQGGVDRFDRPPDTFDDRVPDLAIGAG